MIKRLQADVTNQDPGYSNLCRIGIKDDFTAIAAPASATSSTITGDHTFGVGGGFYRCYTLPMQTEGNSEVTGELGAQNINYTHKVFFPGDSAALQDMLNEWKNKECLFLVDDANEGGPTIQYGSEKLPAYVSDIKFTSGNVYDGKKGWEITVKATNRFFYEGTVTDK